MLTALMAGAVAGLAVALPVGAIGGYLVGLATRVRFGTAAAAALGVATVDGGYALLASLGGAGLQPVLRRVAGPLSVAASVLLGLLALHTVRSAVRRYRTPGGSVRPAPLSPGRAYLSLIALTAVNPATVVTFTAVVLGGGAGADRWWAVVAFAAGALVASALWQLLLVGGGAVLGRVLRGPRSRLGIAVVSAALMLGLAVRVLVR